MSRIIDITGKRFGRLVAIEPTDKRQGGYIVWKCKCDCGNISYVTTHNLLSGNTKSCSCLQKEISSKLIKSHKEKYQKARGLHDGTADSALNSKLSKNNNTGVRGVCMFRGKFMVQIYYKRKRYYIGLFDTLEEAKEARKIAEKEIWGKEV